MRPVLVGAQARPGNRLALIFADRPGHRVTIVADADTLTEDLAETIASAVIPLIGQARTGRTPPP